MENVLLCQVIERHLSDKTYLDCAEHITFVVIQMCPEKKQQMFHTQNTTQFEDFVD